MNSNMSSLIQSSFAFSMPTESLSAVADSSPAPAVTWKFMRTEPDGQKLYAPAMTHVPVNESDVYSLLASRGQACGLTQDGFKTLLKNLFEACNALIRQGRSLSLGEALRLQLAATGSTTTPLSDRGEGLKARVTCTPLKGLKAGLEQVRFRCDGLLTHSQVDSAKAMHKGKLATITLAGQYLFGQEACTLRVRGKDMPLQVASVRTDGTQVTYEVSSAAYPKGSRATLTLGSKVVKIN